MERDNEYKGKSKSKERSRNSVSNVLPKHSQCKLSLPILNLALPRFLIVVSNTRPYLDVHTVTTPQCLKKYIMDIQNALGILQDVKFDTLCTTYVPKLASKVQANFEVYASQISKDEFLDPCVLTNTPVQAFISVFCSNDSSIRESVVYDRIVITGFEMMEQQKKQTSGECTCAMGPCCDFGCCCASIQFARGLTCYEIDMFILWLRSTSLGITLLNALKISTISNDTVCNDTQEYT